ncbi:DNA polymerase III subunit gamma/tau [bacterium]|nr:DNA polymerase III subunit gamma/tau [bacterium]
MRFFVTQPATHQPLARKYRPQTFDQLVGQETTAKALANAIQMGRTPQAVIFSGVRGIGKTTTARLYAKALNCESGPTSTPCGTCESCRAITEGHHEDVLEIDGASNTSVDDVRVLRDSIGYVPQRSKFKIYLIDEVHMLSQSAFNALLKTLEEPPAHVVFLFATTELQKIPQTILSRCQVFLLQKMTTRTIISRLEEILRQEGIQYEPGALRPVAREARGSMRDALTLLDQAIVIGNGKLTAALCESITAQAPRELVTALLRAMVARDARLVMSTIDRIEQTGTDLSTVIEDVAQLARHAFVLRDLGRDALEVSQLDLDPGELAELETLGKSAAPFDLNRIFRTLIRCRQDMDGSVLDRCILENNALEWCLDPGLPDIQQLRNMAPSAQPVVAATTNVQPSPVPTQTPAFPETWADLVAMWRKHRPLQAGKLEDAHPHVYSKEVISLTVQESSYGRCLLNKDEQARLKQSFSELFGFTGRIVIEKADAADEALRAPESLAQKNDRETRERHEAMRANALNHQMTRDVVEIFSGKVEDVRIKDID